ncbi:MAG: hypothetical protein UHS51_06015 [Atopobiaceae bacterium]|nr:hypothetical protein [Atopobiaceae bacterium]
MSDEQKATENEVFNQEISMDDLDAVAGGFFSLYDTDADTSNCFDADTRPIYGGGGFPNCAGTVEDGSWCGTNDACIKMAVDYKGMTDCKIAWR